MQLVVDFSPHTCYYVPVSIFLKGSDSMSFSSEQPLIGKLLNSIYCAIEITMMKKEPITINFAPHALTVEIAEEISNYLEDLPIVSYDFDIYNNQLTIIPLIHKNIFFIDDTQSGVLH